MKILFILIISIPLKGDKSTDFKFLQLKNKKLKSSSFSLNIKLNLISFISFLFGLYLKLNLIGWRPESESIYIFIFFSFFLHNIID